MCGTVQAFALAVEEGVSLAAVTSYMVTFFIMRANVSNKHIYVSDPVWFNETGPSARACWYTFMAMAQDKRSGASSCSPVNTLEKQRLAS